MATIERRKETIKNIKRFIENQFPYGIQTFDNESKCGDPKVRLFWDLEEDIQILFCEPWHYIEVLGITDKEYLDILKSTIAYR